MRGYSYHSLSDTDSEGKPVGSEQLLVGSAEYEHRIGEKWGVATFYDVGNAINDWTQALKHGAGALPAPEVLRMATIEGARALGLAAEIGSLEVGKRADVILVERDRPHLATAPDPYGALVYAARPSDVRTTIVDGQVLVDEHVLVRGELPRLVAEARLEAGRLAARAF